jgi:hypothetical protein
VTGVTVPACELTTKAVGGPDDDGRRTAACGGDGAWAGGARPEGDGGVAAAGAPARKMSSTARA